MSFPGNKFLALAFFNLLICGMNAQDMNRAKKRKTDSLFTVLKNHPTDTNGVYASISLAKKFLVRNPDTAVLLVTQAIDLSAKLNFTWGKILGNTTLGRIYGTTDTGKAFHAYREAFAATAGLRKPADEKAAASVLCDMALLSEEFTDYNAALLRYDKALEIMRKLNNQQGIAIVLLNEGNIYNYRSDYVKALERYLNSLKIFEQLKDEYSQAVVLGNVGIIYFNQKDYRRALECFEKQVKATADRNSEDYAIALSNEGNAYDALKDPDHAIDLYRQATDIARNTGNIPLMANLSGNIGQAYLSKKNYSGARQFFNEALALARKNGIKSLEAVNLSMLGATNYQLKSYREAATCFDAALQIADSIHKTELVKSTERMYCALDSARGNYNSALDHFKRFVAAGDSISNSENIKKQTQLEMQFDFDKKQTADSVRVAEEKKVAAAELRTEKNKSYTLYGGLGLVLIFAGFIFDRFRVTQKQKVIIENQKKLVEEQKLLVEEKNKDILDSIHYAKRIQFALMPSEKKLKHLFNKRS